MTKFGTLSNRAQEEGAANATPSTLTTTAAKRPQNTRQTVLLWIAVLGLLGASARLLWLHPAVQTWRFSRMSLAALTREAQAHPNNAELLSLLGQRLNGLGRYAEAEGPLRRAVGLDPTNGQSRDAWARAQLGIGQITEAFGQLREFAGTNPNLALAHFYLGKFYFTQKSMQHAREEFERTLALDPTQGDAWAYLSQATDQLGEANRPLEAAQKAVSLCPKNAGYHLLLATLLERANRQAEAGKEYEHAVTGAPRNAVMHYQYARWLNLQPTAFHPHAEAEARTALALEPNDSASQLLLGRILKESNRPADALPLLTQAVTALPDSPAPAQALAEVNRSLGRPRDAEHWQQVYLQRQTFVAQRDHLYQQLRVHPEDAQLHRQMADLLGTHGVLEGCITNYAAALHHAPDAPQTLTAAAQALLRGGFTAEALSVAQQAVTKGMHSPDSHEVLGDALLQSGRMDEAIANYNFTTTYAPQRARTLQERVNRYAATHPVTLSPAEKAYRDAQQLMQSQIGLRRVPLRAEELMQKAVSLEPTNPDYLRLLLRLQFEQKKAQEAIATGRRLLQQMPDDSQTHALMAVLLADQAQRPEDLTEAEAHLSTLGNAPDVAAQRHYALGLLALHRHNPRLALAELQQAATLDPDADVAYYKIAMTQQQLGQQEASAHTLATYQERQRLKRAEFTLQGNINQHPEQRAPYLALAHFYRQNRRIEEADRIMAMMRRRFAAVSRPPITKAVP